MGNLKKQTVFIILMVIGSLIIGGCAEEEKTGTANPYYRQGLSLRQQNEMEKAVEAFKKCLRLNPVVAEAHFQLGVLYEDHLQEPIKALYHYSMFLEQMPAEAENTAVASQSLKLLQRELLEQWANQYPEIVHAKANTQELERRIQNLQRSHNNVQELERRIQNLQRSRENLIEQTRKLMTRLRTQNQLLTQLREQQQENRE